MNQPVNKKINLYNYWAKYWLGTKLIEVGQGSTSSRANTQGLRDCAIITWRGGGLEN